MLARILIINYMFVHFYYVLFSDRINFWDFGGHTDYDEIRVELYGQTQVRVFLP